MADENVNYQREFLRSPHHGWMGLFTLGLGFMSGTVLGLILGATGYVLGWIYLPDMGFFRNWISRKRNKATQEAELAQVAEFIRQRDTLLSSIHPLRRERYTALAEVCRSVEATNRDKSANSSDANTDPLLRKLDELMWTYLRMLSMEETLDRFLEVEKKENLPEKVTAAEAEIKLLDQQIAEATAKKSENALTSLQRLRESRSELLDVLKRRQVRTEQAASNLALVRSEQERLDQQIKLLRADSMAIKNTDALTARIDATVEHLNATNQWLAEMDEFKDLVGDMPQTEMRVGYRPPPITAMPPTSRMESPPPISSSRPMPRSSQGYRGRQN